MKEYNLVIRPEDADKRIDVFMTDFAKSEGLGLSRETIQKLIAEQKITVRGIEGLLKPHYKVKPRDEIALRIEEKKPCQLQAEDIPLDIVYEDNDIAVIDKPAGLVVHPAPGNAEHTLVNALLFCMDRLSDINPLRPGIVHRLDKETSGLLVIAKNNAAHLTLAKQFAEHSIKRKYVAVVKGSMEFDEGVIELPIGRHPYKRKNMAVDFGEHARQAKTSYKTLVRKKSASLIELEPFTGRTHQLRVHLSHIGHHIMGDTKYGKNNEFARLALHAEYLGFIHPVTGKFVEFNSPVPTEFKEFVERS